MTTTPIPGAGQTDERALFEAALRKEHAPMAEADLRRNPSGCYYSTITQTNWNIWQAGRAALAAAGAPVQQSEPVLQVRSVLFPNAWHDVPREEFDRCAANGSQVRTMFAAPAGAVARPDLTRAHALVMAREFEVKRKVQGYSMVDAMLAALALPAPQAPQTTGDTK